MDLYIYVCYPIIKRNDDKGTFIVDFGTEMESFISMAKAVNFCKSNYGQYLISIESCDEEIWKSVKNN